MNTRATCVRRRLCMAYIPSGFWSRLISRLIINLKRSGLTDNKGHILGDQNIVYWRRGLLASHPTGKFLVESVQSASTGNVGYLILRPVQVQVQVYVHVHVCTCMCGSSAGTCETLKCKNLLHVHVLSCRNVHVLHVAVTVAMK